MDIKITKKYLVFPVNRLCSNKSLSFYINDREVYGLNIKLDNIQPDFYSYIDVSRFIGKTVSIKTNPEIKIAPRECDKIADTDLHKEPFRPRIHFTAKSGWINDPNGLIYLDGKYHMFYQYNPTEPNWNNMHWGHAVSTDLVNWEELDTAMFPNENGMVYSGCAFFDSRLCSDEKTAFLFYTSTKPFSQRMSYTKDGFETITDCNSNPVLPNVTRENRDPNIVYVDELDCFVMALYMGKFQYKIYRSDNLKHWEPLQSFEIDGDRECPDIFCIHDNNGNKNWVIMGANEKYIIGEFKDGLFVPSQPVQTLQYSTTAEREKAYAGQTFSNMPNGRIVRICWGQMPPTWNFNFRSQMTFPSELGLVETNGIKYITAKPVSEIKSLYSYMTEYKNISMDAENPFTAKLYNTAYHIKLIGKIQNDTSVSLSVFGRDLEFNFSDNTLKIDNAQAPICVIGGKLDAELIIDRCSIEIYVDGGHATLYSAGISDLNLPQLILSSDRPYTLDWAEINSLR